jgi:proteasome accessory factor B
VAVLRYSDAEGLAAWLVGYGADVLVLDPPEVRDAAIARLREIAAVQQDVPQPPRVTGDDESDESVTGERAGVA